MSAQLFAGLLRQQVLLAVLLGFVVMQVGCGGQAAGDGAAATDAESDNTNGKKGSQSGAGKVAREKESQQKKEDKLRDIRIDGVTALTAIFMASFAVDRIATGILFLLSFIPAWVVYFPDPRLIDMDHDDPTDETRRLVLSSDETDDAPQKKSALARRVEAEKRRQLAYHCTAGFLGIFVIAVCADVRLFTVLGFKGTWPPLDYLLTGLILVAGADRVAILIKLRGQLPSGEEPRPLKVTGKLLLDDHRQQAQQPQGPQQP